MVHLHLNPSHHVVSLTREVGNHIDAEREKLLTPLKWNAPARSHRIDRCGGAKS
jgi:hypothetical protein